ncbi:hypothetical protein [Mangrovimonas sp. DI 80]|uniref:hypothetical protein n=1 Tax=Mangrovimonas sp. DI 80 TaxID=1779330 RepID=UPI0009779BCD|nr:hypothetical protein [Mangrovimonas sp. DI 80]OMP30642.1 hypothetical protein BKM32_10395 [Mangrovimonas sp. DI 80]
MYRNKSTKSLYEVYLEQQQKTYHTPKNKEELEEVLKLLMKDFPHNKRKVYDRVFELSDIFYKEKTNEKLKNDEALLIEFLGWKQDIYNAIHQDTQDYGKYNPFWSPEQENRAYSSMEKIMELFFEH